MEKIDSLDDFYSCKVSPIIDNLKKEIGHFNVFSFNDFAPADTSSYLFTRKSYYKISLIVGKTPTVVGNKILDKEEYTLLFANTQVPYACRRPQGEQTGYFCIFTESFFNQHSDIRKYPIFNAPENPVLTLSKQQAEYIQSVFLKMIEELNSDYFYKYDVLRNLILELAHSAMKIQPVIAKLRGQSNASDRISSFFFEALESQFPIKLSSQRINLRSPADFADHIAVHVNHLNRALKEKTGKTTSQWIADRLLRESKVLLQHTNWNINEIGWCLGFDELPHFIHFFKKHSELTPRSYRELQPV